ncbi:MAG TPA: hypothetical protein LFV90_07240 [Rickettsia endosymbiont of Columbicola hoogstraali]|nr:hypothetical protein [Rickettsia endosymbiont of Columbicola hoogstraali]
MLRNYTGLKTSKTASYYFGNAKARFENDNKVAAECKIYANAAVNHAFNVIANSTNFINDFIPEKASNYSYLINFAQIAGASCINFTSFQLEVLIGLAGVCIAGAILLSPSEFIEYAKNAAKAGIIVAHLTCETTVGLAEGAVGILSLIADNIYSDNIELAGIEINTNMIEYHS